MLFHEFGEYGVLALQFGFEAFDLVVLSVLDGLGLASVVESGMAVLEELFEPGIELGGVEVEFIAEVRDRNLVDEVLLDSHLGAVKCPSLREPPSVYPTGQSPRPTRQNRCYRRKR